LTMFIRGKDGSIPIRMGEPVTGAKIAALLDGASAGCGIHIDRGKIFLALMPVTIVDYKPILTQKGHGIGD
ncbi:MAG: hypothetical protein JRD89_15095, partial [Deltaproteobacteria bacterium]|nr:hypothetical protein [Deltaproteobacteria bacterium]